MTGNAVSAVLDLSDVPLAELAAVPADALARMAGRTIPAAPVARKVFQSSI